MSIYPKLLLNLHRKLWKNISILLIVQIYLKLNTKRKSMRTCLSLPYRSEKQQQSNSITLLKSPSITAKILMKPIQSRSNLRRSTTKSTGNFWRKTLYNIEGSITAWHLSYVELPLLFIGSGETSANLLTRVCLQSLKN